LEVFVHWFVVASQKEARVFVRTSDREQLELLKSLTNPLGAVKRRDLIRKEAGRGVKSAGRVGSASYSEPKPHDPHDEAVIQFAKEISRFLESEKFKKNFESLTVVAEPNLLGKIRTEMGEDLRSSVTKWIKKDLQKTPQKALADFLLPKTNNLASFEQPPVR
jgi:protein required for attachment to host cells